ncbi:hypothetical protein MCERE19_04047 [Spirosomataceae bacterium]
MSPIFIDFVILPFYVFESYFTKAKRIPKNHKAANIPILLF